MLSTARSLVAGHQSREDAPAEDGAGRARDAEVPRLSAADAAAAQFRARDAAARELRALGIRRPVLAVVEDAQWLDASSARLLRHLAERWTAHGLSLS